MKTNSSEVLQSKTDLTARPTSFGFSKAKVIAISSQKGGVGKTTTTFNFGHSLVNEGKKVLLLILTVKATLQSQWVYPIQTN